jgi:heterodisulfide reductase subunit A
MFLEPLESGCVSVVPVALVIGAGIAGLTAALNLAKQGFEVKLVEREPKAGGLLKDLYRVYPTGEEAQPLIEQKVEAVSVHPNIDLLLGAEILGVTGSAGDYQVLVKQEDQQLELRVGAIIIATGAQELKPGGMYGYDGKRVITQGELEQLLLEGIERFTSPITSVVMIQCVGARDEVRPYCSRICCMTAVKNALLIKEANPMAQVYVLYRDMMTLGVDYEDLYREARGTGVVFVRYDPQSPPEVGGGRVIVQDELLGEELSISCDLVVLSTPLVSQDDAVGVAQMLRVPTDEQGFFVEVHPKYRPLDSDSDGVFLCGSARWPSDLGESVGQALGAAARASILLRQEGIAAEPRVAAVDVTKCSACGQCELTCNYGAVEVTVVDERRGIQAARVDEARCKGCGACVADCRCRAIDLRGSTNEQILAAIRAF